MVMVVIGGWRYAVVAGVTLVGMCDDCGGDGG